MRKIFCPIQREKIPRCLRSIKTKSSTFWHGVRLSGFHDGDNRKNGHKYYSEMVKIHRWNRADVGDFFARLERYPRTFEGHFTYDWKTIHGAGDTGRISSLNDQISYIIHWVLLLPRQSWQTWRLSRNENKHLLYETGATILVNIATEGGNLFTVGGLQSKKGYRFS